MQSDLFSAAAGSSRSYTVENFVSRGNAIPGNQYSIMCMAVGEIFGVEVESRVLRGSKAGIESRDSRAYIARLIIAVSTIYCPTTGVDHVEPNSGDHDRLRDRQDL
jgi:hypothetical protein